MIAGFQQEQPLAAIFLIRNRGATVLYSWSKLAKPVSFVIVDSPKGVLM